MIYVLEDDESILELVLYALRGADLESQGFSTPRAFWEALFNELPSCIVLDVMLPEEDGLSILKKLRENYKTKFLPIIMLTALGGEFDRIRGLDYGADDYLTKPFSALELLARVKALLRRANQSKNDEMSFKDLYMSRISHSVSIKGKDIHLTLKEFELLALLLGTPNRTFSRDEIINAVWEYHLGNSGSRTIDIHINTLRSKLKEYAKHIKTVRGVGYQFATLDK